MRPFTSYWPTFGATLIGLLVANQAMAQAPIISNVFPAPHSFKQPVTTPVSATLTPFTTVSLKVYSSQAGGLRSGTTTTNNNTISFAPAALFRAGETLSATLTSPNGAKYAWQFTAAVSGGSGRFEAGVVTPISTQSYSQDYLTLVDVDGDADLDVLAPYYLDRYSLGVLRNDGTGKLAPLVDLNVATQRFRPGDVDGDGDLDLVYAIKSTGLGVLRNNGAGTFTPVSGIISTSTEVVALALGDLDSDGDLDLIFSEGGSKTLQVRLNNGAGVFTGNGQVSISSSAIRIELTDLDNDGDLDALTGYGGTTAGPLNIRLNNGQGQFSGTTELPVGGYRGNIGLADFDDDGDVDIAVPLFEPDGKLSLWRNNGNGTFAKGPDLSIGSAPQVVEIGDVDGDKDLDIITDARENSSSANSVNLNLNTGTGNFIRQASIPTGPFPIDLTLGDMDNDGDLDLVVYSLSGNSNDLRGQIIVHRNANTILATQQTALKVPAMGAWPNPVERGADLHFETATATGGKAALYNTLGCLVRELAFEGQTSTLPTAGLTPGVYLLTVTPIGQHGTTKRVILR
ncbi:T9SS type A sorting domain-containing protein [Hymenobacter sp. GOD-10R]|uniref:T9SS type A sorting domain-containing protein n=1 Tax=Hymenobacter sp. GOD-10R TaxID=3093922 RepID=UPI002D791DFB|nr:T9SS type A sorting domain-containing protein [Hymenobacter sp. GOD-10R]WRQ29646.1 T9SS type A sorting domain-containing protein [Hymenobacter sp. GOD-10R]